MLSLAMAAACALTLQPAGAPTGRTAFVNANIYTVDAARPRAGAIAVDQGRILAVGSDDEVRKAAGPGALVVDLGGRTVLPGLIDAHGHMASLGGFGMGVLEFGMARSFEEVVTKVSGAAKAGGGGRATGGPEWILGGRWDHESWSSKQLPTHGSLSAAVPDRPVWLRRVDGHAGIANQKAMELAGVGKDTPSPAGGEILRDGTGKPTGVFVDNAMSLITRQIPASALGPPEDLLLKAQEMCLAAGLTGVHDAGVAPGELELYKRLADTGRLKIRIYAMVSGPHAMRWFDEHEPLIGERLTIRSAKLYMDGAMGSRGAWLLEPYADRPTGPDGKPYTGLAVSKTDLIEAVARHGLEKGYQVCTHAIGDRGNRETLDAYERAIRAAVVRGTDPPFPTPSPPDHRFRIEHAQLLSPADLPRFAQLGIIPAMQPTHCTSDMRWVDQRVGPERARGAYAWTSLLRTGARIAAGSDFPVESHNPFLGLHAAITREDDTGLPPGGWHPDERMTREEALRAFTRDAAYAAFQEHDRGSLSPGKLADFIVIDRDVMVCGPPEIRKTRVLQTVVGGETVYLAPPSPAPGSG